MGDAMKNDRIKIDYRVIITIGIIGSVYLSMKYVLPLIIPFLIAYIVVVMINPLIKKISNKLPLNPSILAGILLSLVIGVVGYGVWILLGQLVVQVKNLIGNMDSYVSDFYRYIRIWCNQMESYFGIQASTLETNILYNIDNIINTMKSRAIPNMMGYSWDVIQNIIKVISVIIFTIISIILLAKEYGEFHEISQGYSFYSKVKRIADKVFFVGGTYLKAQIIIMFLVGILCVIGLIILGNPYALLLGLSIGLLDALPVFGTGSIFVPWGIIKVFQGDFLSAAILGTTYLVTSLLREFLEPRLIGKKVGVSSLIVLASIYIGIELYGIAGFILGPLSLLLIVEIRREVLPCESSP